MIFFREKESAEGRFKLSVEAMTGGKDYGTAMEQGKGMGLV